MDYGARAVDYLRTLESRDLDAAASMLAAEVTMVFPGGLIFHDIYSCIADRSGRYRSVRKQFDGVDVMSNEAGDTVVYTYGTLHGVALDGSPIDGVRFIDRFMFRDDLIVQQDVWNDLSL